MLKLKRSSGNRFYKRLFLLSVEGSETEVEYFKRFNSRYPRSADPRRSVG